MSDTDTQTVEPAGWQPIGAAPKDCWIIAYRPLATIGTASAVEVVRWAADAGKWVWADHFNVYHDDIDERDELGYFAFDLFESAGFTHWMPLPDEPAATTEGPDA